MTVTDTYSSVLTFVNVCIDDVFVHPFLHEHDPFTLLQDSVLEMLHKQFCKHLSPYVKFEHAEIIEVYCTFSWHINQINSI